MADFIEERKILDWEVLTDTGFKEFKGIGKTIKYKLWKIYLESGEVLKCADEHIVYKEELVETFIKDLKIGDKILTENKYRTIINIEETNIEENMYDLIDVDGGRYFTNKVLSHNSTATIAFALHSILFKEHQNIAILANKSSLAIELLGRMKLAYEHLPLWIQQGIVNWNKGAIELENGSKITAAATSSSSIRGGSFNTVILDEFGFVPPGIAEEFMDSVYPTISSGKTTKMIITSCVDINSLVLTNKGYVFLDELVKYKNCVKSYYVDEFNVIGKNNNKPNTGNIIVNSKAENILEVKSELSSLICSDNHKIYGCVDKKYGWFDAKDYKLGDYICHKVNTQIFGNEDECNTYPYKITPNIAYILGLCAFEKGHFIKKINNKLFIVIKTYKKIQDGIKDLPFYIIEEKEEINKKNNNYKRKKSKKIEFKYLKKTFIVIDDENFYNYYSEFSLHDEYRFSNKIMRMSKENIIAFLQGVIDNYSWISKDQSLLLGDKCKDKINQIKSLLLNLGLFTTDKGFLKSKYKYLNVTEFSISVPIGHLFKFLNTINPRVKDIHENAKFLSIAKTGKKDNFIDIIPYSKSIVTDILNRHGHGSKNKNILKYTNIKHLSRKTLQQYAKSLIEYNIEELNDYLKLALDDDFIWSKVKYVKNVNTLSNMVYDLSLNSDDNDDEWNSSITYNTILTHNTPHGMNLFYKIWMDAIRKKNNYIPIEINWDDVPGRDETFKENTIKQIGERSWQQEYECVDENTNITIYDENTKTSKTLKIKELIKELV